VTALDPAVTAQLARLRIVADRPLIVCDVDEVVVHFLRGLEAHLQASGYWLDPASFALNGNIRRLGTNEQASTDEVRALTFGYFDLHVGTMEPIEGAVEALLALGERADIVLLTNLPPQYLPARVDHLASHGLTFPVIANVGPKGPTVSTMIANHGNTVVFLDDIPANIHSVAEHTPHVGLIHFMQDVRFARLAPEPGAVLLQTDNWTDARRFLDGHFSQPRRAGL
jgi:hypothetical protein